MRITTSKVLSTVLLGFAVLNGACASGSMQDSSSNSSATQNQMPGHEAAARKALEALPVLVTKDNFAGMGFGSVEEARTATLGTPTPRRTVGYDKLLSYQPGTSLSQLFDGREEMVYPVLVGQSVKTSIVVAAKAGAWQISNVGNRHLADVLTGARQATSATPGTTPTTRPTPMTRATPTTTPTPGTTPSRSNLEIISMPGINFEAVSFSEGDQTLLQPAEDLPEAKLFKGQAVKAEDALVAISNYAKEFDRKYGVEIRKRRLVK